MTLCLTLGALAELEHALEANDLVDVAQKFSTGHVSARHLLIILGAGLRGAGHEISDEMLSNMTIENGLKGAAQIVARLLEATFGSPEE